MRVKSALIGVAAAALSTAAFSSTSFAAPCITTVLSNWLESAHPGFNCTVGDKTFSDFTYNPDGFNVPATAVGVTPVGGTTTNPGPGIQFNGAWANNTSAALDGTLSFIVTAPASTPITDASLLVSGIVAGTVFTDTETLTSPSFVGQRTITANNTNPSPASITFSPGVTTLDVADDFSVSPGGPPTPEFSIQTKQFSETSIPEPASLALLGAGLATFGLVRIRRRRR